MSIVKHYAINGRAVTAAEYGAYIADRLPAMLAKAWEEGFDAGERDVMDHERDGWREDSPCIPNPYREPR